MANQYPVLLDTEFQLGPVSYDSEVFYNLDASTARKFIRKHRCCDRFIPSSRVKNKDVNVAFQLKGIIASIFDLDHIKGTELWITTTDKPRRTKVSITVKDFPF